METGTVVPSALPYVAWASATFAEIPADQIKGSYDPQLPGYYDVKIYVDAKLTPSTSSGSIGKAGSKSPTVGIGGNVAIW